MLHLNRAACHLRRLRAAQCEADSSAALELLLRHAWGGAGGGGGGGFSGSSSSLPPRCPQEHVGRALIALRAAGANSAGALRTRALVLKALSRRLAARSLQGAFRGALADCEAAVALADGGEGAASLSACGTALTPLAAAETQKCAGDAAAKAGDAQGALAAYAAALVAAPTYVAVLLNRSALLLSLSKLQECVTDCETALSLLARAGGSAEGAPQAAPVEGSELAEQCKVRALARREAALKRLGEEEAAVAQRDDGKREAVVDVA